MNELYKKYRPTSLKEVIGQEGLVKTLSRYDATTMPHMILLSGPTGTGKTTIARILAKTLGADHVVGVHEVNCATETGIDFVRTLSENAAKLPMLGAVKVFILDECHQLTSQAQAGLLKMCEDTPKHVYYIFVTTNPEKIIKTLKNRGSNWALTSLDQNQLTVLIDRVAEKEKIALTESEVEGIVSLADGSARQALQLLEVISKLDKGEDRRKALAQANPLSAVSEIDSGGYRIAQALGRKNAWNVVAQLLRETTDDPETIRWIVLAYARTMLLGGNAHGATIIQSFQFDFLQSKNAGLALACYQICGKKG